ncbi:MAG: dihydroxyacetone kinase subunit DhaL [Acidaminococcaceae bacterium]|uniref:dihydroxyacetone kinase subunit DhaL n=1 Tax=uncultured Phascolarctobacterium sp. TaxID=512296 RepID=UPI0025EFE758|nr:dihydroxyacetone kinase subunit DhaL [uncultured Phascolarctobacterium sp.]MDO5380484.1 dihydroxyacetone kinase subunit DhaL [Acidaminococcaceae bacterium]
MLTLPILRKMLHSAATELKANSKYLCELDGVAGDGDHGITIGRMADVMQELLDVTTLNTMRSLLDALGDAFMGINGGSAGPLWGTVFTGMAEGIDDQAELTDLELRKMFTQAKLDFMDISKAKPGDKTMVDALYPAIDAIIETQGSLKEIMDAAAAAAKAGAEATSQMVARFGRAKNMGERSIGTKDPGAVSIAILFDGMAKAL